MATCTLGVATVNNTEQTVYTSSAFTPASSDLIVLFLGVAGESTAPTITDSQSLGWSVVKNTQADASGGWRAYCYVANALASASSMTITATFGATAFACIHHAIRVAGLTRTGSSAIRQSADDPQQTTSIPGVTFSSACLTENPVLGCVFELDDFTVSPPPSFTERAETATSGVNPGTNVLETVTRDSGHTSSNITWSVIEGSHCSIGIELDTSAATSGLLGVQAMLINGF